MWGTAFGHTCPTYRITGSFLSYPAFSKQETPVILRMVNDHPYGVIDLLRFWMRCIG